MKEELAVIKQIKAEYKITRKTKAINPKHQKNVNLFVLHNLNYDMLLNENDCRDSAGLELVAVQNKQEKEYNLASEKWGELPKRERLNLVNSHEYLSLKCY